MPYQHRDRINTKGISERHRRLIVISGIILTLSITFSLIVGRSQSVRESPNYLLLGTESSVQTSESVDILRMAPTKILDAAQIEALRTQALTGATGLLRKNYRSSQLFLNYTHFDQPWETAAEKYLDGNLRQIDTPPAAELDIANPLLLVRPEITAIGSITTMPWNTELIIRSYSKDSQIFPYAPKPSELTLNRASSKITATYYLNRYIAKARQWTTTAMEEVKGGAFYIVAYNAADLGYPYVQFDYNRSAGITPSKLPNNLDNSSNISRSFWYVKFEQQGCLNNTSCNKQSGFFSPAMPTFSFNKVPSKAVFNLYRSNPETDTPDTGNSLTYEIKFE